MRSKKYSKDVLVTLSFMSLLILTAIYDIFVASGEKLPRIILIVVTIIGLYYFYKKSFLKKSTISYYIILGFIFLSMYLANVWGFYGIPYYDKFLHLGSGAIIAIIGYIFYLSLCKGKENKDINSMMPVIFVIIFSIAVAAVWEIWEFTTDFLFGLTAQNGSLIDTMWDIICGTVVGIITSIPIYLHSKGKNIKIINYILDEMKK